MDARHAGGLCDAGAGGPMAAADAGASFLRTRDASQSGRRSNTDIRVPDAPVPGAAPLHRCRSDAATPVIPGVLGSGYRGDRRLGAGAAARESRFRSAGPRRNSDRCGVGYSAVSQFAPLVVQTGSRASQRNRIVLPLFEYGGQRNDVSERRFLTAKRSCDYSAVRFPESTRRSPSR